MIRNFRSLNPNHLFSKPFSLSSVFSQTPKKQKKPLSAAFKESVGISEKSDELVEPGEENPLIQKLRVLSQQVKTLENDKKGAKKLNLFTEKTEKVRVFNSNVVKNESNLKKKKKSGIGSKKESISINEDLSHTKKCNLGVKNESTMIYDELSPDMEVFVRFLEEKGYFKDANFVRDGKLDLSVFREFYARSYLVSAAVKFAKQHQEIAKWLSASDLKKVATFGCPSLGSKTVHAAKHLREFFKIEEVKVCQSCVLKESCRLADKRSEYYPKLLLSNVMRVSIMYAMESVPQQVTVPVPEEIKSSVSILLKEVMGLSKTVS